MRMKSLQKRKRALRKLTWRTAVAAWVICGQAVARQPSPEPAIRRFFEVLVGGEVQKAAQQAAFSDEAAKTRFVSEWTPRAPLLSGYRIEEWEVEAEGGSADVALEFRDPDHNDTLKVKLVKLNGVWKVAPEQDFNLNLRAPASVPKIENLEELVDVTSRTAGERIELSALNRAPCSVLFRFDVNLPASLRSDRSLPVVGIVPPGENPIPFCNLRIVGGPGYNYSVRYSVKRADDNGEMVAAGRLRQLPQVSMADDPRFFVGESYGYGLPYPAGEAYLIWQGPAGAFSHGEPGSRYAVDFSMPLGSEVAAARGGVVIGVIQKNPDNQDENPAPPSMANEILVLHSDGTMGVYAHLTTGGAKVSFGQSVRRGEVIGFSGNSGYSRGPHLHFAILGYQEGRCVSVPFGFLTAGGTAITPCQNLVLLAEKDGTARVAEKETRPRKILHKKYDEYDTEIHYFARTVEFLASNKTRDPVAVELSFSKLYNAVPADEVPRRVALPADGVFHHVLTLALTNPDERSSFAYLFRRVELPGKENVPLRVERDDADDYVVEIRYFSDRIEFYAKNKTSRALAGTLDFLGVKNLAPQEKLPREVLLPANASAHYLATLRLVELTKGYSFRYQIGPGDSD